MAQLRRAVIGSSAVAGGTGIALALVFGLLLEPGQERGSCQTGLYPSTYADLLLPLHLFAFTAVTAGLLALARELGNLRVTAVMTAAGGLYLASCLIHPPLFAPYAVAALLLSVPTTLALGLRSLIQIRAGLRDPSATLRWQRFARVSWAGQWIALAILLPAAYAWGWLSGAGVLCF
jgi:hypothetical protein